MNDNYETQILNFFTEEDNFRNMLAVNCHADKVRKFVFNEFWRDTSNHLKSLLLKENQKWEIELSPNIFSTNAQLRIYKLDNWLRANRTPLISIAVERLAQEDDFPYIGIWLNNAAYEFDLFTIRESLRTQIFNTNFEFDSNLWWVYWQKVGLDFSNIDDLCKILPKNESRDILKRDIVENLLKIAKDYEILIDNVINQNKIKK